MVTHSAYRRTDFGTLIQAIGLRRTGDRAKEKKAQPHTDLGRPTGKIEKTWWHRGVSCRAWEENSIGLNSDQPSPRARAFKPSLWAGTTKYALGGITRSRRLNTRVARGQRDNDDNVSLRLGTAKVAAPEGTATLVSGN